MKHAPGDIETQPQGNVILENAISDEEKKKILDKLCTEKTNAKNEQQKQKQELEKEIHEQEEKDQLKEENEETNEKEVKTGKKQSLWRRFKKFFSLGGSWWSKSDRSNYEIIGDSFYEKLGQEKDFDLCEMLYKIKMKNGDIKKAQKILEVMRISAITQEQEEKYKLYVKDNS